jgi:acyl-CoA reductase-like NAD-dependent aldehyde dehydrogenase
VVFDSADLTSAVNGVAFAAFVASGQTCVSGTRILIHDSVYEEFMARFLEKVGNIRDRMGDRTVFLSDSTRNAAEIPALALNPKSTMGTVISPNHLSRIVSLVNSRSPSSTLLAGGEPMQGTSRLDSFDFSRGSFYPPTVIADIDTEEELWKEEVFGPVVVVKRFSSEEEGVRLANDCKYGLGAGIWTSNLSQAHRVAARIDAGLVWVNTHHRNDPSSPWCAVFFPK